MPNDQFSVDISKLKSRQPRPAVRLGTGLGRLNDESVSRENPTGYLIAATIWALPEISEKQLAMVIADNTR